jgi:LacI family transcriptional regulator
MKKARVTLADVARKAGVHPTTVSVALRDSPRIPRATRSRLKRIASQMGYVPDPGAQKLASYRGDVGTPTSLIPIAYVTNWHTRWGWQEVIAHPLFYTGAQKRAGELGLSIEHFWLGEPDLTHQRLNQILESRGINGIVLASHVREIDEEVRLDWDRFSAVKIDYIPHRPALPIVTNDQISIVRLAVEKATDAGYERIGFVIDEGWEVTVDNLLCTGFLGQQRFFSPDQRIKPLVLSERPEQTLDEWITANRPEVIISYSGLVLPTLQAIGLKVPDDIAFIDIFVEDDSGQIAGVRQNCEAVGAIAIGLLADRIRNNMCGIPEIPTRTLVEGSWIDGKSLPRSDRSPKTLKSAPH